MELKGDISSSVIQKSSFKETEASDWQRIVEMYPAFGAAHLFYAEKLKEKNEALFFDQLPKTALRFGNIFKLNFLLNDVKEVIEQKTTSFATNEAVEELIEEQQTEDKDNAVENKLAAMLQAQAADFAKPVKENEALPIDTEPLYKIDYFASQGISIVKSQDDFGNKVKKFTDWLKDIKKTSAGTPQLNTTADEEKLAAAQANASLKQEEVITEPMAEVLAQQGKKQQASELYKKLSLLYPEKSAYFAAKINSLQ